MKFIIYISLKTLLIPNTLCMQRVKNVKLNFHVLCGTLLTLNIVYSYLYRNRILLSHSFMQCVNIFVFAFCEKLGDFHVKTSYYIGFLYSYSFLVWNSFKCKMPKAVAFEFS